MKTIRHLPVLFLTVLFFMSHGTDLHADDIRTKFELTFYNREDKSSDLGWRLNAAGGQLFFQQSEGWKGNDSARPKEQLPRTGIIVRFFIEPVGGGPRVEAGFPVSRTRSLKNFNNVLHYIRVASDKGGYITADYSKKPPAVKLEAEPSTYSQWKICDQLPRGFLIEQQSPDPAKQAYLSIDTVVEEFITPWSKNTHPYKYRYCAPTLSFEKSKSYFSFYTDDGGK